MTSATDTHVLLRALVDELARCGMEDACTSPGSRSTPMVLALASDRRLRCHSHIDERCSGFFALGLAKASGLPVAITCTSGTAVAELLPAAIEAREARVPLLLLTADRPTELRESGAGQTIDQIKLFGSAAKWFFEVDLPDAGEASLRFVRTLACRAYWTALEGRPGAVHLNFPLREPLVLDGPLPAEATAREDSLPYVSRPPVRPSAPAALRQLAETVAGASRVVLVAGRDERRPDAAASSLAQTAAELCEHRGWPLLADPLSGARRGGAAIAHYDLLLRDPGFAERMRPDLVLRVGDLPTSKPLRAWLAALTGTRQIALDPEAAWQDPANVLSHSLALDPRAALGALAGEDGADIVNGPDAPSQRRARQDAADGDWLAGWRSADARAAEAIRGLLDGERLSEPSVAAELGVLLPAQATLFVSSSMPVRDVESFWPVRADPPRVLSNRGANGIDGTVSSAFGAAAAGRGPVVLLIGDVALAHDIGGLLASGRLGLKLTIVLIDNGGGGIFDFLPVARAQIARQADATVEIEDLYTRHIATPTGLDFSHAAALYGLRHMPAPDIPAFRQALERSIASPESCIIELRTERAQNVTVHERCWRAVSAALGGGESA